MVKEVNEMVDEMSPRENFKRIMSFRKPDRMLWMEGQLDTTLLNWIRQGLPLDRVVRTSYDVLVNGAITVVMPMPYTLDASGYFGFLPIIPQDGTIELDFGPLPRNVQRILRESGEKVLCATPLGGKMEYSRIEYAMPHFVEFPVQNMKDWREFKKRFNPADLRRYPKDYTSEQYITLFEELTGPTTLVITGFYAFGRAMMGTAAFTPAFYVDSELVRDMMDTYADFLVEVMKEAVETLKSRIDWVFWYEDLAHGVGPNISPRLFKDFILPNLKKVTGFLNKNGIDLVIMDCDGNFGALMPLLWEGGIRGALPLEVNAGIDAVQLRKQYGRTWRFIGNIDKRELPKGEQAIRREVDRRVPWLKEDGGYIPALDHEVPPNVSLKDFTFYADYLKSVLND
jgi:uroporphyrinogen-III decarboxylase